MDALLNQATIWVCCRSCHCLIGKCMISMVSSGPFRCMFLTGAMAVSEGNELRITPCLFQIFYPLIGWQKCQGKRSK